MIVGVRSSAFSLILLRARGETLADQVTPTAMRASRNQTGACPEISCQDPALNVAIEQLVGSLGLRLALVEG